MAPDRTEVATKAVGVSETMGKERGDDQEVGQPVVVMASPCFGLRRAKGGQSRRGEAARCCNDGAEWKYA